ncbi:branched-chain amino acid transport system permease protein [Azospirillum agricola]|uniref:ABC transporter permease n=1 Tax=Azospirillum agricola TaxID=1720247 RepID=UPI001AE887B7|nr:ABC transporter permease [Azospirillum agricola]MBP2228086.1 branched-chain amino acid transport system permease protein [Azospirillum agricola]
MSFLLVQALSGLATAATLFLVSSGLTIVFGVTRIVNFAHGSFYMLGAYLGWSLVERFGTGVGGFWASVVAAALGAGALGALMEVALLRRLYRSPELFQLLGTFGVVLVLQDAASWIWGSEDLLGRRAPGLKGSVEILGQPFPLYDLMLIGLGPLVLGLLWLLFNRTRWGTLVRAATQDRDMASALGVDPARLFTGVLFLGSALAGLGGALQVPREAVNLHMDMAIVVEAFVVVVVGGMGSLTGAFLASLLIGQLQAFGILVFPQITLVLVFLFMAVVLVLRPHGLMGRAEETPPTAPAALAPPLTAGRGAGWGAALLLAALALVPLVAGDYALIVLTEMVILALLAASLHLLIGLGGLVSFGHAAWFGLGAYGAALLVKHLGAPMPLALAAAPLVAGIGALIAGWFCVRRSGLYFAMLTLAFAQIVWSVTFQWYGFTGGDNGIVGVWPPPWAAGKAAYYWLTLGLCAGALALLRRAAFAPFGYALRAGRDSALRAESVGIDVRRHQWLAFALAGSAAGLAGGLYAFSKGSVFPTLMAVPVSVDALVMVLMGGIQTVAGPLAGAAVFHLLEAEVMRMTELWRLALGLVIVALVLLFPKGIVGFLADVLADRRRRA